MAEEEALFSLGGHACDIYSPFTSYNQPTPRPQSPFNTNTQHTSDLGRSTLDGHSVPGRAGGSSASSANMVEAVESRRVSFLASETGAHDMLGRPDADFTPLSRPSLRDVSLSTAAAPTVCAWDVHTVPAAADSRSSEVARDSRYQSMILIDSVPASTCKPPFVSSDPYSDDGRRAAISSGRVEGRGCDSRRPTTELPHSPSPHNLQGAKQGGHDGVCGVGGEVSVDHRSGLLPLTPSLHDGASTVYTAAMECGGFGRSSTGPSPLMAQDNLQGAKQGGH